MAKPFTITTRWVYVLRWFVLALGMALPTYGQTVKVGPNVLVSKGEQNRMFFETEIAARSSSSGDLIGCAMATRANGSFSTVVFVSFDGGQHWKQTLDVYDGLSNFDPSCTFGSKSTAYFISFGFPIGRPDERTTTRLYRSLNSGRSWTKPDILPGGIDRTWVTVDTSRTSKYRGWLYVMGKRDRRTLDDPSLWLENLVIFSSSDDGSNFRILDVPSLASEVDASRPILLPSGALGVVTSEIYDSKDPKKNKFTFVKSTDGGESITAPTQMISSWSLPAQNLASTTGVPTFAIDRSGGQSTGRLYYAWEDWASGETVLRLIASPDSGRTWSRPIEAKPSSPGASIFSAALAVNRDGIVGLVYYERRSPQKRGLWHAYFTASTDGGKTFLPSVALSDQDDTSWRPVDVGLPTDRSDRFAYNGGDTVGLAATADGIFHPFWVDSRTGSVQLWTASVLVSHQ